LFPVLQSTCMPIARIRGHRACFGVTGYRSAVGTAPCFANLQVAGAGSPLPGRPRPPEQAAGGWQALVACWAWEPRSQEISLAGGGGGGIPWSPCRPARNSSSLGRTDRSLETVSCQGPALLGGSTEVTGSLLYIWGNMPGAWWSGCTAEEWRGDGGEGPSSP